VVVTGFVANGNGTGITARFCSIAAVGQSTITRNAVSWSQPNGGFVESFGDNNIILNHDGGPGPTTTGKK